MASEQRRGLADFPTELLYPIFFEWVNINDLKNLRLVSQRFNSIISPMLIYHVSVSVETESLLRLERIAQHPLLSKGVKDVEVNLAFYDARLALNVAAFARHQADWLESYEFMQYVQSKSGEDREHQLLSIPDVWSTVRDEDFDEPCVTEELQHLLRIHSVYFQRFLDQEQAKEGAEYVRRICAALPLLTALESIIFTDYPSIAQSQPWFEDVSGTALMDICLRRSDWAELHQTTNEQVEAGKVLSLFFEGLQNQLAAVAGFHIELTTPKSLWSFQLVDEWRRTVRKLSQDALDVTFQVHRWNNDYSRQLSPPREDMLKLGSFTRDCFHSSAVRQINLSLFSYTQFVQRPHASLSDFIDLTVHRTRLHHIFFQDLPCSIKELRILVNAVRATLTILEWRCLYLLTGSWPDALDILRGLEKLEHVQLRSLMGAELGVRYSWQRMKSDTEEAIEAYVLRTSEINPLLVLQQQSDVDL